MTHLDNPDFVALARSFGVAGESVTPAGLPAAVAAALDLGRTTVLHLRLDLPQPHAAASEGEAS
jgi:thiamine pyrophosphate-dependent acetolactate synthase large subunit-like protein